MPAKVLLAAAALGALAPQCSAQFGPPPPPDPGPDPAACSSPGDTYRDSAVIDSHLTAQYSSNSVCMWTFTCSNPRYTPQVIFGSFDTEANFDFVYVYDGACAYNRYSPGTAGASGVPGTCGSAPILASLHGQGLEAPDDVQTGSGSTMVMVFDSDGSVTRNGFEAEFTCVSPGSAPPPPKGPAPDTACTSGAHFQDSGVVDSHLGEYSDDAECLWSFSCTDRSMVPQLVFTSFDTETNFDFIYVFDGRCPYSQYRAGGVGSNAQPGSCGRAPVLATLHGSDLPAPQIASTADMAMFFDSDGSVTRDGFEVQFTCVPAGSTPPRPRATDITGEDWAMPSVMTQSTMNGYVTYRMMVDLTPAASNIYALYGNPPAADTASVTMQLPAAYQEASPFGANIGGVNPQFFAMSRTAMGDSWLTIGETDGDASGMSSIGIDWESWTERSPLVVNNGAVFWTDPSRGPSNTRGGICLGQASLREGIAFAAVLGARGNKAVGGRDWAQEIRFQGAAINVHPPAPSPAGISQYAQPSVDVYAVDGNGALAGYTTYRLQATLTSQARNIYTIYGNPPSAGHGQVGTTMTIPPAFQTDPPMGANIAGGNPAFFTYMPTMEFDSWLTIGKTTGDQGSELSSIGIDFADWSETNGLSTDNGAIFFMNPEGGPSAGETGGPNIVLAQITIPSGTALTASMGVRGRKSVGSSDPDWDGVMEFSHPATGGNAGGGH